MRETEGGPLAWGAGGCSPAGPLRPLLPDWPVPPSATHTYFSLAAVAEEMMGGVGGGAGGAGVISGPACLGTCAQSLWGTVVKDPRLGEGPLHALQRLLPQAESGGSVAASAPGRPPCTGAHLPPLEATSDPAPTGAPPTRDKVPLLCDHLKHPMWQPPHPGCGTLTRQHPSPPYPIHMGSPVPLLTTITHVQ